MIDTAVVLARGLGTRMRAEGGAPLSAAQAGAAAAGHKALMPIGGHRLIDYSLSALADAGIRRAVVVVAPEHDDFLAHREALAPSRLTIDFAVQDEPLGTAHALAAAREAVGGAPFLMVNGDNIYPVDGLVALGEHGGDALLGFRRGPLVERSNIPAERVDAFALLGEEGGILTDIVEKPAPGTVATAGPDALVSMNCFAFTERVFDACARTPRSVRGEHEIVDAVRLLDDVAVIPFSGGVVDLSRRDDIAEVERIVADRVVRL
ncbi:sugar phosphate nucleotidyltransferase [Brachybacterium huguangmaarense]